MKTKDVIIVSAIGSIMATIGYKFGNEAYEWLRSKAKGIKLMKPSTNSVKE